MAEFLELWWVFPVSIIFSTLAIGSGVSGALFFSPFFMLVVGLSPVQAVGAGLLTEVFGMGNGLRSYVRARLVDYATAKWLLLGALPLVILGAHCCGYGAEPGTQDDLWGWPIDLGGVSHFGSFARRVRAGRSRNGYHRSEVRGPRNDDYPGARRYGLRVPDLLEVTGRVDGGGWRIADRDDQRRAPRNFDDATCRSLPRAASRGHSDQRVFTLAIVAAAGAAIHALHAQPLWHVVGWSIPGVLIGSTIGSRLGKYLPAATMEKALGVVFAGVGLLVLALEYLV